jgi:hypothetical protein
MDASVMFVDCPAYMNQYGVLRCGLPAEIEYRYTIGSTDGPLESAKIRCPRGHWFNGPVESLTWRKDPNQELAPDTTTAGGTPHSARGGR